MRKLVTIFTNESTGKLEIFIDENYFNDELSLLREPTHIEKYLVEALIELDLENKMIEVRNGLSGEYLIKECTCLPLTDKSRIITNHNKRPLEPLADTQD